MTSPATSKEQALDNLSIEMMVACCQTCLLSEAMKDCKHCIFNIGLPAKMDRELKPVKIATESKDRSIECISHVD